MHSLSLIITTRDRQIAGLTTLAISLHLLEATLPSLLPGVKPGIANIVVLFVLYRFGWATAASVSVLRVMVGSLLFGQILTPTFFLSMTGALSSLAALGLISKLPARYFGPVSLSIIAAMAHSAGQLWLVRLWLIPVPQTLLLLPPLLLASIVFGLVNGLIVAYLLNHPHSGNSHLPD